MTRWRKEIKRKMYDLEMQENAEYELGCGYCSREISEAFNPFWEKLHEEYAKTYGLTVNGLMEKVYKRQCEAYDAGRIPWSPCYGFID